jgi:predicted CXXCH cytochrome family protein
VSPEFLELKALSFMLRAFFACTLLTLLTACGERSYTPVPAPPAATPAVAVSQGPIVEDEKAVFATYAGDAACKSCHAAEYEKWQSSNHGLAERSFRDDLDKPAFQPTQTFPHGSQSTTAALDAPQQASLKTPGFSGRDEPWKVERVIGHFPLRQFLIPAERGRFHATEACWDPAKKEWFNVYGNEDRKPGEWGHWTGRGMSWNTMCAGCHNTRVRKNYDPATDSYSTSMAQMTVSCEACHGPMKTHATAYTAGDAAAIALQQTAAAAKKKDLGSGVGNATARGIMDNCAGCHARRTELTGDQKPGDKFFDHYHLALVDHTDTFYADGQIREEDYEFGPFMASRMQHAGVRCLDCHDPHSAKTLTTGNALCMRCHTPGGFPNAPAIFPAQHTFHGADSTGSQCINCHMPQTTYMQRHSRHDHGFTIPDPKMTQEFGIPNACNKCHTDQDTTWSLAAVEKWYGPRMERRTRTRTTLFAKAKRGDTEARDGLVQFLSGDDTPYWKASACLLLDRWLGAENVRTALIQMLGHEHELVRGSAIRALEAITEGDPYGVRQKIRPLLADPMRNVRVAAAWALRDEVDLSSAGGRELLHMLTFNSDQPSGQMQLAHFEHARGNVPKAITHMQAAIHWDSGSPPFRHDLAMMHSLVGDLPSSIKELQAAIQLAPQESEYRFKLALAYNELGDTAKTLATLKETVQVEPNHARAWYNLGLALDAANQTAEALDALRRSETADPRDGSAAYAAATLYYKQGNKAEAKSAIWRALNARPNFPEALELRAALERK